MAPNLREARISNSTPSLWLTKSKSGALIGGFLPDLSVDSPSPLRGAVSERQPLSRRERRQRGDALRLGCRLQPRRHAVERLRQEARSGPAAAWAAKFFRKENDPESQAEPMTRQFLCGVIGSQREHLAAGFKA